MRSPAFLLREDQRISVRIFNDAFQAAPRLIPNSVNRHTRLLKLGMEALHVIDEKLAGAVWLLEDSIRSGAVELQAR